MAKKDFWDGIQYQEQILNIVSKASKRIYIGVLKMKTGEAWWSDNGVEMFQLDDNTAEYAKEKSAIRVHPDDKELYVNEYAARMRGEKLGERFEYRLLTGKYSYSLFSAKVDIIKDEHGENDLMVVMVENHGISDDVDAVTGLYRENLFEEHVTQKITDNIPFTVLKVGIDQFSHINIMYGMEYANKVLSEVAYFLRVAASNRGLVYRLSGAHFALVFENITPDDICLIYECIQDSLAEDLYIAGKKVPLKVAGGALVVENSFADVIAIRSRLSCALKYSEQNHHGELVLYNGESDNDIHEDLELIGMIHQDAVTNREGFYLCYQPIVDKSGTIKGMEALLRWKREPYGVVPPNVFIEWLEEDPCIYDLGNWIIEQALTDAAEIAKKIPDFFVHVNISSGQIERHEFRQVVLHLLNKSGLKPEQLCMELTERCRELDVNFLRNEIEFFKSKGIKVAMDDFGTGNSSLSIVLDLPVDELKIDMSFVREIQEQPMKQAMVSSIVAFANDTDMETCIEGVEDEQLLAYLQKYNATWHQGYFYSRPIPFDEFKKLINI
ncbi:MAG: EAL domain-containing protein [Eubacterium sp.]|nr:EAL domain-containing protein [Eubacterium sp.]